MTKHHMNRAAELVKAILNGEWTNEPPSWAEQGRDTSPFDPGSDDHYTRAVQTAEAFILLFNAYNDRFDEQRFLVACGLAEPVKKEKR